MPRMLQNWDYDTTEFGQLVKNALLGKLTEQFDYKPYILAAVSVVVLAALIAVTLSKRREQKKPEPAK